MRLDSLDWLEPLQNLRHLQLPGTSLAGVDLAVLARLPRLKTIFIPVRARHRAQIYALAETAKPFRELVKTYEWLDAQKSRR